MTVTFGPPGGRDNAIALAFSLGSCVGSCVPATLTRQDNALCTNLWISRANWLVSACPAVDERGCGNVDNRGGARSCQVAGLRCRLLAGPGRLADLTLSDKGGIDLTRRTIGRGNRDGSPAELPAHNE
jgi:hypothetical protein